MQILYVIYTVLHSISWKSKSYWNEEQQDQKDWGYLPLLSTIFQLYLRDNWNNKKTHPIFSENYYHIWLYGWRLYTGEIWSQNLVVDR